MAELVVCECGRSAHLEWNGGRSQEFATRADGRDEVFKALRGRHIRALEFNQLLRELDELNLPHWYLDIPRDAFCEKVRVRK